VSSYVLSGSQLTVHWKYTNFSLYYCWNVNVFRNVVLDLTNSSNASYYSQYPSASAQYINIAISCPTTPASVTDIDSGDTTYTYPSGCVVTSASSTSNPSPPTGMCF
jgi:hypothetical protein